MSFEQALNEVLRQKKYDVLTERSIDFSKLLDDVLEKILAFIFEHIKIPDWDYDLNFSSWANIFIVIGICAAIALAAVAFKLITGRRKRYVEMEEIIGELKENKLTVESLLERCKSLAAAGNFREAVRYGFIAALWTMHVKKIIFLDKSKTGGQLRREARQNAPTLLAGFSQILETYNYAWFGHKDISPGEFSEYDSRLNNLLREVKRFEITS